MLSEQGICEAVSPTCGAGNSEVTGLGHSRQISEMHRNWHRPEEALGGIGGGGGTVHVGGVGPAGSK